MDKITIITNPSEDQLLEFVHNTKKELIICVPFFDYYSVNKVLKKIHPKVKVKCLLGFSQNSLEEGGSNIDALRKIIVTPAVETKQITNLHAKTYISDCQKAIITSGNLTKAGILKNIEIGVFVEGKEVKSLHKKIMNYWKNMKTTVIDDTWLQRNSKNLKRIEQNLKNKKPRKSKKNGIGGHKVNPEGTPADMPVEGKWAIVVAERKGRVEELLSIREGTWVINRRLNEEKISKIQAVYFERNGYVMYKGLIQKSKLLNDKKTELTIFNLKEIKPVEYTKFNKIKDGKPIQSLAAFQNCIYVYDQISSVPKEDYSVKEKESI